MIPKIVLQTARNPLQPYILEILKKFMGEGWQYEFYNDDDIKDFFKKNPLKELPEIEKIFNSVCGQHKADLFRYYFLYIKGGVYIDSDAMVTCNLDDIIKDHSFFYVKTNEERAFNGFIGCSTNNQIMYDLLVDSYNVDLDQLGADYHLFCKNFMKILKKYKYTNIKEFQEQECIPGEVYNTIDVAENKTILHHYYLNKIIPKDLI
jgi:hypothetical protein